MSIVRLPGVKVVGRTEHKISQFTDNTVIFLASVAKVQNLFDMSLPINKRESHINENHRRKD